MTVAQKQRVNGKYVVNTLCNNLLRKLGRDVHQQKCGPGKGRLLLIEGLVSLLPHQIPELRF